MSRSWIVWQLIDATFPSGGFAHSGGLEAVWQWGELRGSEDLNRLLQAHLSQAASGLVPFVTAAHQSPEMTAEIDAQCDSFLSNHVANRASRAQGTGFLATAEAAFQLDIVTRLRSAVAEGRLIGHWPPIFGAVTGALGVDLEETVRMFLHMSLRDALSSAVRLNVIGPMRGQAMHAHLASFLDELARRTERLGLDDVSQTAPVVDILQATQDRLYSRLFQS